MKCPRDGAALEAQRYEADVMVDACGSCGGVWLDHGELEAIQESREKNHAKALEEMQSLVGAVAPHDKPGACPKCGAEMASREYAHCSRITIDACPDGHGIWLDGGELKSLELFFETNKDRANTEDDGLWAMRGFWVSLRGFFKK